MDKFLLTEVWATIIKSLGENVTSVNAERSAECTFLSQNAEALSQQINTSIEIKQGLAAELAKTWHNATEKFNRKDLLTQNAAKLGLTLTEETIDTVVSQSLQS